MYATIFDKSLNAMFFPCSCLKMIKIEINKPILTSFLEKRDKKRFKKLFQIFCLQKYFS